MNQLSAGFQKMDKVELIPVAESDQYNSGG